MKSIVVIPVYREKLTELEKASLIQVHKILNKHDFALVCPTDLDAREYEKLLNGFGIKYRIERFDGKYFKSTKTYNLLMLDVNFYKRFAAYDYVLIYQLDSYVFRDELDYWCEQGYDFIGAPWNRFDLLRNKLHILKPGVNGGFSLRKIPSFIKVLEATDSGGTAKKIMRDFIKSGKNEDGFFSWCAVKIDPAFKMAPLSVAAHFSFERKPEKLFKMTNGELPFGCHAWARYNPRFWKKFINNKDISF
jgi:hypothetical protein